MSWIDSTQIFSLLAMALPGRKLLDMGYFRITALVGSLIYAFSYWGWESALDFCMSLVRPFKFIHRHTRRALAMGIVATGF
ncbi:hypothetical protein Ac2012v2_007135 [Leucoagaricus gongylophorus]